MEKQDLTYMDQRIQQVEDNLENRLDEHGQRLQKVADELREQLGTLLEQIVQSIGTTDNCQECQLCKLCQLHTVGSNLKDCKLLRKHQ